VHIKFTNLTHERPGSQRPWDTVLGVVADLSIEVDGHEWYSEPMFPILEFAQQLTAWCAQPPDERADFLYETMESEDQLVQFHRYGTRWSLLAPFQKFQVSRSLEVDEIDDACRQYIGDVEKTVLEQFRLDVRALIRQNPGPP
jgi:hypothetical protein